ncbi:MAG: hypothetical protein MI866_03695, partial [Bacteroidales bacterium]|nr:hypothetical protein [Bacteroidales bacterium]
MKLIHNIVVVILLLSVNSCGMDYFYPDSDSYREPDLIGTWGFANVSKLDSSVVVFTEDGYHDVFRNPEIRSTVFFGSLSMIWHNIDNDSGTIFRGDY